MALLPPLSLRVAAIGLKFLGLVGKGGVIDLLTLGTKGLIEPLGKVRKELGLISALASTGAFSGFETLAARLGAVAKVVPGLSLAGPALGAIVTALAGITLPVAAGIAAVAGAGFLIYKYWNRIGAFVSGFASAMATELQPALDAIRPVLDWFAPLGELIGNGWNLAKSALDGVGSLLSGLFSQEQLTPEQEEALRSSGRRLAEALVGAFSGVGQMLSDAITGFNWVQTGIDLMNAIWKGMKSIASKMVADLANQIASINPFGGGGGGDASGPRQVQPGDKTPGGDVIGDAFAKGGRFNSGVALVGEEGPELVEFGGPGNVHTAAETRGILGGAGGSGVGSITIAAPLIGSVTVHNMADVDRLMNEIGQKLTDMISGIQADTGYRVV
ncbi:hypothetical protein SAMN05216456_1692 [Devosia crocina]|uniref:Phage tail tape measure protein, TP901 family, core region n=1 Tax=Devosia crocina TaxID=429728 RepID=A0A1I7ND14_9HYPH|nr:hypothetical protein [Devosia crocina]SFV32564.1 hypothetical protein SAMN05216456_1692 [Devosia crocina]